MDGLKTFARGGEAAIVDMMGALDRETQRRIDAAVAGGCAARIVLEIDAITLAPKVLLELRDVDGKVHEIATYSIGADRPEVWN